MQEIEPRAFINFIKVVVNIHTGYVAVGMKLHASASTILGDPSYLYGANISLDTGEITWESTLNIKHNEDNGTGYGR